MTKTKTFNLTESEYHLVQELLDLAPGRTENEKLIQALELVAQLHAHTDMF